ncbi:MAG: TspO/MBR family protein [Candidatus Binatia bacterium]
MRQALGLIGWIAVCFAAAVIGAQVTDPAWYESLKQPDWAPPSWLFGPVWTVLYLFISIAAWLVWNLRGFKRAPVALGLFLVQLVFNAAWSWLFFGLRRPDLAFAEIVLLWVLVLATLAAFGNVRRLAAWLLLPYLIWVTFAAMLNFSLWQLYD